MEGDLLLAAAVLFPFAGALAAFLAARVREKAGTLVMHAVTVTEALLLGYLAISHFGGQERFYLSAADYTWKGFCGLGISFTLDGFRAVHGLAAALLWAAADFCADTCMRGEKHRTRFNCFSLLTLGATMGVFLSADLYTTFIFFELMSFASFVWVAQEETKEALSASKTYLAIAVAGGLVMLMGLFLLYSSTGTLQIGEIMAACEKAGKQDIFYAAGLCLLFGFGAKAGLFGLHVWMPESYGQAPAPASALLSGMLSKTGIFGIIIVTENLFFRDTGWGVLITVFGLLTMAAGAVLAVCSVQVKRLLAFSSMSQIGFMIVGIGIVGMLGSDGTLAARGTALHMLNHSLVKLVLFVIAGVILMNAGSLELNRIRGYGRKKTLLKVLFLAAALGIGGIPLFNGYISKTLLHEGILEAMNAGLVGSGFLRTVEAVFLISGGCTIAYMAKLFIAIFVEKNEDEGLQAQYDVKKPYIDRAAGVILSAACGLIVIIGCLPGIVADGIMDRCLSLFYVENLQEKVRYYSYGNLKGAMISLLIGVIIYFAVVRVCLMTQEKRYGDYWPKWWNTERVAYKPIFLHILPAVCGVLCRIADSITDGLALLLRRTVLRDSRLPHELEEGTILTNEIGGLLDYAAALFRTKAKHEAPFDSQYRHRLAVKYEEIIENRFIIVRSLSFGLLLFCLGLCFTLIYILF